MRRLQLELPLLMAPVVPPAPPANDGNGGTPPTRNRKRGAKTPEPHGRPKRPAPLPRIPEPHLVQGEQRVCPNCKVETTRIGFKTAEKLDIKPAEYVVKKTMRETVACTCCHQYMYTVPKHDEVLDRGILGNELLVQAFVDHYEDAVPWERMERHARQQDVPLSANTLASSVGRVIDLFEPVVMHIANACLASTDTALDATRMPVLDGPVTASV